MIFIFCPSKGYETFYLLIEALKYELSLLGIESIYTNTLQGVAINSTVICFGYQCLMITQFSYSKTIFNNYKIIIYNTEQLSSGKWDYMLNQFKKAVEIWDYSNNNIKFLSSIGINNTRYIPFAYSKTYELINDVAYNNDRYNITNPNGGLAFIGTPNNRRDLILNNIEKYIPISKHSSTFFDNYIKLLKSNGIFVNIHYYIPSILEIVRIIPLICNRCCVITEHSDDPILDEIFSEYVNWIDFQSDYKEQLISYINNSKEFADIAYNKFKNNFKYSDLLISSGCITKLNDLINTTNMIHDMLCESILSNMKETDKFNALYGTSNHYIDVTAKIYEHFINDNCIHIPEKCKFNDYFGDPLENIPKTLIIIINNTISVLNNDYICDYRSNKSMFIIPENNSFDLNIQLE